MKVNVKANINVGQILRQRGLGDSTEAQLFLANEVARQCDPYVPMADGTLKNFVRVTDHSVEYQGPYAHYQYVGEVMAGRAPKHYTGQDIQYHGGPMRGKEWDKRMIADHKEDIIRALDAWIAQHRR